jgi:hypothetical protein
MQNNFQQFFFNLLTVPLGSASAWEVMVIIAPVTGIGLDKYKRSMGIGYFSKQNLYLFILKQFQINWLVWGEDEGQSLLYS